MKGKQFVLIFRQRTNWEGSPSEKAGEPFIKIRSEIDAVVNDVTCICQSNIFVEIVIRMRFPRLQPPRIAKYRPKGRHAIVCEAWHTILQSKIPHIGTAFVRPAESVCRLAGRFRGFSIRVTAIDRWR
jgi:hypothetical protein